MDQRIDTPRSRPLFRMVALTAVGLGVGTLASLAAIGLIEVVGALNRLLLVDPRVRVQMEEQRWLVTAATLIVPCLGGLIVGLAHRYLSPEHRPLGPPDVIRAVQFDAPLPGPRSGFVSTATAALSLGVGASVGQYGPMVYLGAMVGGVGRRLRLGVPHLPAIAIGCGVAAAISTAFNAPIAGLVFAHEVVLRHYATQAFAPVTVAAASGYIIANLIFDRPALFLVEFAGVAHGYEFTAFAGLGLVVAIVAVAFMRILLRAGPMIAARIGWAPLRPAAAGLALGATALVLPDVLGIGTATLRFATIEGAFGGAELLVLILAKMAVTILCLGAGFSGGVFSPALLIGSLMGALIWTLAGPMLGAPTSGVSVYAICGMMAFASAVIGAPLTCILIVFELTRSYDVTIAAMVAVVFSNLVSHRLFGRSLFDVQLAARGVDLSRGRDHARMAARPVVNLIRRDLVEVGLDARPQDVAKALDQAGLRQAFVTGADGRLAGMLGLSQAYRADTVATALTQPDVVFDDTMTVADAIDRMRGFVGDAVPVVAGDGRYLGAVTEADIISAWRDDADRLREEEHASL